MSQGMPRRRFDTLTQIFCNVIYLLIDKTKLIIYAFSQDLRIDSYAPAIYIMSNSIPRSTIIKVPLHLPISTLSKLMKLFKAWSNQKQNVFCNHKQKLKDHKQKC